MTGNIDFLRGAEHDSLLRKAAFVLRTSLLFQLPLVPPIPLSPPLAALRKGARVLKLTVVIVARTQNARNMLLLARSV